MSSATVEEARDVEAIRARVSAFCAQAGYVLSPQADVILRDLAKMKQSFGDFYCSCQPQQLPETVCVCQAVRLGLVDVLGACFCNLIVNTGT